MIAKRLNKLLCGITVMLVILASITCVSAEALDNGIYTARSTPHYKHPVTGEIEDSGGENSQVLGQSMTESALYPEALIEVDPDGRMFATIRLKLMDNIENPTFKVQNYGDSGFWDVGYDVMKEDFSKNESDFRFEIPNENCIIRATFYVVPMGRDVIFYIDFSDIHDGSSDFVTSVEVRVPETDSYPVKTEPVQTEIQPQETQPPQIEVPQNTTTTIVTTTTQATTTTEMPEDSSNEPDTSSTTTTTTTITTTTAETSSLNDPVEDYTIPDTVENNAKGVAFFNENGSEIFPISKNETTSDESEDPKSGNGSAVVSIGIAAAVAFGCVGGFVFYRRRRL